MSELPLVTAIVNCYNHAPYLEECLESVRRQRFANVQLIVMDDASTDGSPDLIRGWMRRTGTTCTFVANESNRGLAATRNVGLALAEGEYVAWVSTDDVWLEHKLDLEVRSIEQLPSSVGVLYTDADRIDDAGKQLPGSFLEHYLRDGEAPPQGDLFETLLERNFIANPTVLVRRSCLQDVGGYDTRVALEDWDLWVRLARITEFAFLPDTTARYRELPGSRLRTMTPQERQESTFLIALKHVGFRSSCDAFLRDRIRRSAAGLYYVGSPGHRRSLWRAVRLAPSLRLLGAATLASLRVPPAIAIRLRDALRRWW